MSPVRPCMTTADRTWWTPIRSIDGIDVIHVDLRPDADCESRAASWLDERELKRLHRFRVERPRREFALCRSALRINLCKLLGCTNDRLSFGALEHGKPFAILEDRSVPNSFNVSHSDAHGLIAFASSGRLGVDAEFRRENRDFDGIAERVFGPSEREAVKGATGSDKVQLFYRLWTMKEALIKALGTGFSLNPARFEVPARMIHRENSGTFRFPHLPADRWRIECLGDRRFAAALAWEFSPNVHAGGDRESASPVSE